MEQVIVDDAERRVVRITDPANPRVTVVRVEHKTGPEAQERTLRAKAEQGIGTNLSYLGIASPTAAQQAAQIARLTRQVTVLLRLVVGAMSDEGT